MFVRDAVFDFHCVATILYLSATACFFPPMPSVHHSNDTSTIHNPSAVMASTPIRPIKASSNPAAVISGQILGAAVACCVISNMSCFLAASCAVLSVLFVLFVLFALSATSNASIVVYRARASNGLVKHVV